MKSIINPIVILIFVFIFCDCKNKKAIEVCLFKDNISKITVDRVKEKVNYSGIYNCKFPVDILDSLGVKLSDYNAENILLNFWFVECPPCIAEIPMLNSLDSICGTKLKVIGYELDSPKRFEEFNKDSTIRYTNYTNAQLFLLRVRYPNFSPTSFILRKDYTVDTIFNQLNEESLNFLINKYKCN